MRSLRIDLTYADAKVNYEGMTELEIIGRTVTDQSYKLRIMLAPTAIGYLAERLHKAVREHERNLNEMKSKLRGDL